LKSPGCASQNPRTIRSDIERVIERAIEAAALAASDDYSK
jgi:hypothetical protein